MIVITYLVIPDTFFVFRFCAIPKLQAGRWSLIFENVLFIVNLQNLITSETMVLG